MLCLRKDLNRKIFFLRLKYGKKILIATNFKHKYSDLLFTDLETIYKQDYDKPIFIFYDQSLDLKPLPGGFLKTKKSIEEYLEKNNGGV